jgi:hypothetical protein
MVKMMRLNALSFLKVTIFGKCDGAGGLTLLDASKNSRFEI